MYPLKNTDPVNILRGSLLSLLPAGKIEHLDISYSTSLASAMAYTWTVTMKIRGIDKLVTITADSLADPAVSENIFPFREIRNKMLVFA